jgi:hypothetical protein
MIMFACSAVGLTNFQHSPLVIGEDENRHSFKISESYPKNMKPTAKHTLHRPSLLTI